jgi:GAF domain-containing protein
MPAEYVIPLPFEGRNLGILTLGVNENIADASQQAGAREIAARIGAAIGLHRERTLLAERRLLLRRSREFAQALLRHSGQSDMSADIMAALRSAIRCTGVALVDTRNPTGLIVTAADGSLQDRVGRTVGGPYTVAHRAVSERRLCVDTTGMSCAVFLPLEVDDRLLGMLWIDRQGLETSFSDAETEALGFMGPAAAIALATAGIRRSAAMGMDADGSEPRGRFDAREPVVPT